MSQPRPARSPAPSALRVLHATALRVPLEGIVHQLLDEQRAAEALALPWRTRLFSPLAGPSDMFVQWRGRPSDRIGFRRHFYRWLHSMLPTTDLLVLRYLPYDPMQRWFLMRADRPVYFVLHTRPVEELVRARPALGRLQSTVERLIGPASLRAAAGIIAVTREIGRHEVGRARRRGGYLLYPNGALWPVTMDLPDDRGGDVPELAFVASQFASWHGLDVLLAQLPGTAARFRLHLIGQLPDRLARLAARDPRCVIHGTLELSDVARVLARSWIGLSSFAHSRLPLAEACPLKTREYLRRGLPVYGAYREVFPPTMPFYRQGACDIDQVLRFASDMRDVDRARVAAAARPHIDKGQLLGQLYEALRATRISRGPQP